SRCHAWSATPTYDLSREVLGVRPLAPGYERFALAPHLGDPPWARAVIPSSRGDITVAWQLERRTFTLDVDVPAGTQAQLALPAAADDLVIDGGPPAPPAPRALLAPGHHRISARFPATPSGG